MKTTSVPGKVGVPDDVRDPLGAVAEDPYPEAAAAEAAAERETPEQGAELGGGFRRDDVRLAAGVPDWPSLLVEPPVGSHDADLDLAGLGLPVRPLAPRTSESSAAISSKAARANRSSRRALSRS